MFVDAVLLVPRRVAAKENKLLTYEKLNCCDKMKDGPMRGRGKASKARMKVHDIMFVPCEGELLAFAMCHCGRGMGWPS